MKAQLEFPETLQEAINYFGDADRAHTFMAAIRWPDGRAHCPRCNSEAVSFLAARRVYKCRGCDKQFSVKRGTIFEDSPLGFDKWLPAFWMIVNAKNGISSCELGRALGVTQKTAWFMLHRVRLAIQDGSICKFAGNVEVDETWIGGKARNMHKERRERMMKNGSTAAMTPVMGFLERNTLEKPSRVKLKMIKTTKRRELQRNVREYVLKGSALYSKLIGAGGDGLPTADTWQTA